MNEVLRVVQNLKGHSTSSSASSSHAKAVSHAQNHAIGGWEDWSIDPLTSISHWLRIAPAPGALMPLLFWAEPV